MEREGGAAWKEANLAVQQIMDSYAAAGPHRLRSETLLAAGLKYMADLRKNAIEEISVPDAHSLMRAIETLDLMDNGESSCTRHWNARKHAACTCVPITRSPTPCFPTNSWMYGRKNGVVHKEWRQCWN